MGPETIQEVLDSFDLSDKNIVARAAAAVANGDTEMVLDEDDLVELISISGMLAYAVMLFELYTLRAVDDLKTAVGLLDRMIGPPYAEVLDAKYLMDIVEFTDRMRADELKPQE